LALLFLLLSGMECADNSGYTVFSEWLNIVVRASWDYSERMPVVSALGLRVGVSPLLQWIVVPSAAFAITKALTGKHKNGGLS
jgi:hypothetical protein